MSTAKSIKYTISEKKSRPKDQLSICEIVPHVVEYSAFAEMSAPMDPNDDDESIKTIIDFNKCDVLKSYANLPANQRIDFAKSEVYLLMYAELLSNENYLNSLSLSELEVVLNLFAVDYNTEATITKVLDLILTKDLFENYSSSANIISIVYRYCSRYRKSGVINNFIEKHLESIRLMQTYSTSYKRISLQDFAKISSTLIKMGKMEKSEINKSAEILFNLLKREDERDKLNLIDLKACINICRVFKSCNEPNYKVNEIFQKFIPLLLSSITYKNIHSYQLLIILDAMSNVNWENNEIVNLVLDFYNQKELLDFTDPLYLHNIALDLFIAVVKQTNYSSDAFTNLLTNFIDKRVDSMSPDHLSKCTFLLDYSKHFGTSDNYFRLKDQIAYFQKLREKHRFKIRKIEKAYMKYLKKKRPTIREIHDMNRYR